MDETTVCSGNDKYFYTHLRKGITLPMRIIDIFESQSNMVEVYHGDDYNTRSLEPRLMNNGNNQEGVGIYFSDRLETTRAYGRNIVKTYINMNKFVESRKPVSVINSSSIVTLLRDMSKVDKEAMFYIATDYGIYLEEPDDLGFYHIEELYSYLKNEEIRNFQTMLAGAFGVENFVKSWNKWVKIDGTWNFHNSSERWFAIINPSIKVERI